MLLEKGRVVMEGAPAEVVEAHVEHSARSKAEREAELQAIAARAAAAVRVKAGAR